MNPKIPQFLNFQILSSFQTIAERLSTFHFELFGPESFCPSSRIAL